MVDALMETNAASNMIGRSCEQRAAKAKEKPKTRAKMKMNVLSLNSLEKAVLVNVISTIDQAQTHRTGAVSIAAPVLNAIVVVYADS